MSETSKKSNAILQQIRENSELNYNRAVSYYMMEDFNSFETKDWELFFPKTLGAIKDSFLVVDPGKTSIRFYFKTVDTRFPDNGATAADVTISNFPSNCGTLIFNNMRITDSFRGRLELDYNILLEELEILAYSLNFTCVVYNSTNQERYKEMNKTFASRNYVNVFEFINARSSNTNYFWFKNLRLDE